MVLEVVMQQQIDHAAVKAILNVLRRKIARRTTEDDAASMLARFIKELTPKYEFLRYITINQSVYSESETIKVSPQMNYVDEQQVFSALQDLVKKSVHEMKEKADFFFIREFQDAFEDIEPAHKKVTNTLPLNEMQHEYLINRTQTLSLEKNQLLVNLIHALLSIENKVLSEIESVHLMEKTLRELLPKYHFFHSIDIIKNPNVKGYYTVEINGNVQTIPTYQFADAIYDLIIAIGTKLKIKNAEQFQETLKQKLGERNTELLRKVNVPIDQIYFSTSSITKKDIVHQLIKSLIIIIGDRTSHLFALAVMKKIIDNIKSDYELFSKTNVEKKQDSYDISFSGSIEAISDEEFRRALKALIEHVGAHLGKKRGEFISELKRKLGDSLVKRIENLGLNFHMLEMKFD